MSEIIHYDQGITTSQFKVKTEKRKEHTGRICEMCGKPVFRKYEREIVKKTGILIGDWICVWNQWKTCSLYCHDIRIDKANHILYGQKRKLYGWERVLRSGRAKQF